MTSSIKSLVISRRFRTLQSLTADWLLILKTSAFAFAGSNSLKSKIFNPKHLHSAFLNSSLKYSIPLFLIQWVFSLSFLSSFRLWLLRRRGSFWVCRLSFCNSSIHPCLYKSCLVDFFSEIGEFWIGGDNFRSLELW